MSKKVLMNNGKVLVTPLGGAIMVNAASSEQADWNQNDPTASDYIKNRPGGYDSSEPIEITWDGNIGDKEIVSLSDSVFYICVSDEVFTLEQLEGVKTTMTVIGVGEETYDVPYSQFTDEIIGAEFCLIISVAGTTINGLTFPVAGVYFVKADDSKKDEHWFISKIAIPAKVAKIPNKYLDAPSTDAVAEIKTTAETAKTTAETAKTTAETAKTTAETADNTAYSAQVIANQCVKFQAQNLTQTQKQQARKNIDAISYSSKEYIVINDTAGYQFNKTVYYYSGMGCSYVRSPISEGKKYYINSKETNVYKDTASGCLALGKTSFLNELVQYDLFRDDFPYSSDKSYPESQFTGDSLDILVVYNPNTFTSSVFSKTSGTYVKLTYISNSIDSNYIPIDNTNIKYDNQGRLTLNTVITGTELILKSSTKNSTKKFKITVDDTGALTATEITS